MNYNSEEEKKFQKSFAEKIESVRKFMRDKDGIGVVMDALAKIEPVVNALNEKARSGEKLTDSEKEMLNKLMVIVNKGSSYFNEMKMILDHNILIQSDVFFFHVRKLAEEGDEEAKKAYVELLPLYKKAHGLDSESIENKN